MLKMINLDTINELIDTTCPYCDGEGIFYEEEDCPECGGWGYNPCENCEDGWIDCPNDCIDGYIGEHKPCPVCDDGSPDGTIPCPECIDGEIECDECRATGIIEEEEYCEHCSDGYLEILFSWAYHVPRLDRSWTASRIIAASTGYVLFEYDDEYWLGMCGVGQDNSWRTALTVLRLAGYLPYEYAMWISDGAYVFVNNKERKQVAAAALKAIEVNRTSETIQWSRLDTVHEMPDAYNYVRDWKRDLERAEEYMEIWKYRILTWIRVNIVNRWREL